MSHMKSGTCRLPLFWWKLMCTHHKPFCFHSLRFYSKEYGSPSSNTSYTLVVCPTSQTNSSITQSTFGGAPELLLPLTPFIYQLWWSMVLWVEKSESSFAESLLDRLPTRYLTHPSLTWNHHTEHLNSMENLQLTRESNVFQKYKTLSCSFDVLARVSEQSKAHKSWCRRLGWEGWRSQHSRRSTDTFPGRLGWEQGQGAAGAA